MIQAKNQSKLGLLNFAAKTLFWSLMFALDFILVPKFHFVSFWSPNLPRSFIVFTESFSSTFLCYREGKTNFHPKKFYSFVLRSFPFNKRDHNAMNEEDSSFLQFHLRDYMVIENKMVLIEPSLFHMISFNQVLN